MTSENDTALLAQLDRMVKDGVTLQDRAALVRQELGFHDLRDVRDWMIARGRFVHRAA